MAETAVDVPTNKKTIILVIVGVVCALSALAALVPASREYVVTIVTSLLSVVTRLF
jgi:hypothetical protein